ncbi:MAG TPA: CHAD domain-containing protein [Ktedonobacteraceae bacterium]|nr:CHAD domain-containing protein [Ktedonobacteraceae bacterium]
MAKARPITGLDAQAPAASNARLIVKARLEDLLRWEVYVDHPYNIRELHDLRIAAKRLRYSFEVFEEMLPGSCGAFVTEITRLQDELGDLHDSDVLIAMLRLSLAAQDSDAVSPTGQAGQSKQHSGKTLVSSELAAHILQPDTAPTVEQRYGLELLLQRQEQLRDAQYTAFRQHWYQLKARDFRREIITILDK